jgi:hypothetical protein
MERTSGFCLKRLLKYDGMLSQAGWSGKTTGFPGDRDFLPFSPRSTLVGTRPAGSALVALHLRCVCCPPVLANPGRFTHNSRKSLLRGDL